MKTSSCFLWFIRNENAFKDGVRQKKEDGTRSGLLDLREKVHLQKNCFKKRKMQGQENGKKSASRRSAWLLSLLPHPSGMLSLTWRRRIWTVWMRQRRNSSRDSSSERLWTLWIRQGRDSSRELTADSLFWQGIFSIHRRNDCPKER